MKKVKFVYFDTTKESIILDDDLFLGGKKVVQIFEDGITGYTSVKLVKIIN